MTSPSSRHSEPRPSPRVASLFDAAAARGVGPVAGEEEALAAFRSEGPRRVPMIHGRSFAAALAASATAAVLVTGGVAAAVPGPVSDVARATAGQVLRTLGISVPTAEQSSEERPRRDAGPTADVPVPVATPGEQAVVQDSTELPDPPDDGDVSASATATQRVGVQDHLGASQRATTTDVRVVEEGGELLGPAAAAETGVVVPEGDVSASATPTETGVVEPEGDGVLASATAPDTAVVEHGAGVSASATAPDGVGVEQGGETSPSDTPPAGPSTAPSTGPSAAPSTGPSAAPSTAPSAAPSTGPSAAPSTASSTAPSASAGESRLGLQDHAPEEHGRADEGGSGDVGPTSEAGGPGEVGDSGSPVEPGISTERDDVRLPRAARAGDGRVAPGGRHRH